MLPVRRARTASITAAYVATYDAMRWMIKQRMIKEVLLTEPTAAISVGIVRGQECLDLNYEEDSTAGTDMNVVCTGDGGFVEVQGTAEGAVFDRPTLDALLDLAVAGCAELTRLQAAALAR